MPLRGYRHNGVNEVGHINDPLGTPADVDYGNTQQSGVTVAFSPETVDLMSAQAKMKEDSRMVSSAIQLQFGLVTFDPEIMNFLLGQAAAQHTGDTEDASNPTDEVVAIAEGSLGEVERSYYFEAPGPYGPIRAEVARGRIGDIGDWQFASNAYLLPSGNIDVLNTLTGDSRPPFKITWPAAA